MKAYIELLQHVMAFGKDRQDRTGVTGYEPHPAIKAPIAV